MKLEAESSFGGTDLTTGTPQFPVSSGVKLLQQAPSYIDPPSFEETIVKNRSRSHSVASTNMYGDERDIWENKTDYVVMQPSYSSVSPSTRMVPNNGVLGSSHATTSDIANNNTDYNYDDSDNSVEKKTLDSVQSEGTELDDNSEYTQYSHLAGAGRSADVSMPTFNGNYHSQFSLPPLGVNATGVGGSSGHIKVEGRGIGRGLSNAISVGEMVHNRLQAQSPTEGIKNYATYV